MLFFIGQCHFLVTTTNDNSCESLTVAKPKEWLEFSESLNSFNTQLRLTFCTLKAIFKQLHRWQSTSESGKTKKKEERSLKKTTHCSFTTAHDWGEGFGLFGLQTHGSLHSSKKNTNSISKLNPASCPFYLGQLFLCPTTSPSTMPVPSHHLCKLPSTVSRSAFLSLLGFSTQGEHLQDVFSE